MKAFELKRLRVYVSGPYTNPPPPIANVANALIAGDWLLENGFLPFIPHLNHSWDRVSPKEYQVWLDMVLEWVPLMHALLRLPGYSPGADTECALAEKLGIPVFTERDDLLVWQQAPYPMRVNNQWRWCSVTSEWVPKDSTKGDRT